MLVRLCCVAYTALLFATPVSGTPVSESPIDTDTIVFSNFSNQLVLLKQSSYYRVKGTRYEVQLSNRIIIKTSANISKEDIYTYNQHVSQVSELFSASTYHYYLITLNDADKLASALKELRALQDHNKALGIELVQPDVLQLKTEAGFKPSAEPSAKTSKKRSTPSNNPSPYLSLLGIQSLWTKTKGQGVKIAVIDDGFNLSHPDLRHIKPVFSYDAESKSLTSLPHPVTDRHGTKVAGIIFAAHNHFGIDGIAPEAELIALRQPDTWTSNTLLSFQLARLAGASIINCSWHSQWLSQPIADAVNELAEHGRDGKGIAVIFAAGNKGQEITVGSSEAAIDKAIVVGANDADFRQLDYSNYGETVDVWTYGKGVKTTLVSGRYGIFAGTSLATAIVSGTAALLISNNPNMTLQELFQNLKSLTKTRNKK